MLLLSSCAQNPSNYPTTSTRKNFSEMLLESKPNTLEQSSTIESEEIHDSDPPQSNNPLNNENSQFKEYPTQSVVIESKDKSTTTVKETLQNPSPDPNPSTTSENTGPTDLEPKPEEPPVPQPILTCPNALYDVNQPCDWIHPNLRPVDEQERTVPSFMSSQEAWNWGNAQMMDESSKWYMCG